MFLELMVAQLRYQDPLNPSDSGEFLAQSAQFTALEKMQDVADRVGAMLGAQMAFGAGAMVGQHVSWIDEDGDTLHRHHRRRHLRRAGPGLRHRRHRGPARAASSPVTNAPAVPPATLRQPHRQSHRRPPGRRHRLVLRPERNPHASLTLLRHQRPACQPDDARRDRQQHRQRQHGRLQGQHHRLPGHPEPGHGAAPRRPATANGGTNPVQVGLGVQVAATTGKFTQGSAQVTGSPTDLMIQGDGMFVLGSGDERVYTRAGAFTWDGDGNLVAPSGKKVQGYAPGTAPNGPLDRHQPQRAGRRACRPASR